MFLFSFKATKQIPKCLNRSLETPGPVERRPGEAFQLRVHKKQAGRVGNVGARCGRGDPGGDKAVPRAAAATAVPCPRCRWQPPRRVTSSPHPQNPSGIFGPARGRRWRRDPGSTARPRSHGGAGRGARRPRGGCVVPWRTETPTSLGR